MVSEFSCSRLPLCLVASVQWCSELSPCSVSLCPKSWHLAGLLIWPAVTTQATQSQGQAWQPPGLKQVAHSAFLCCSCAAHTDGADSTGASSDGPTKEVDINNDNGAAAVTVTHAISHDTSGDDTSKRHRELPAVDYCPGLHIPWGLLHPHASGAGLWVLGLCAVCFPGLS